MMRIPKCQTSTRNGVMSRMPTRSKTGLQSVEIPTMQKAFNALQKYQCKAYHKFRHFTSLCYQKKQAPYKSKKPKVHQTQAGAVYAKESTRCGQSEDYSSSDESFCLQMKVQQTKLIFREYPGQPT